MAEIKYKDIEEPKLSELAQKMGEIDVSIAGINALYARIDACTTIEELQAVFDEVRAKDAVLYKAHAMITSAARDRIESKAELL